MQSGEVGLLTNDVCRLADFYKRLLGIGNGSDDPVHQCLIAEETALTIYNDGTAKNNQNQNICLAFTVEDIEQEYQNWPWAPKSWKARQSGPGARSTCAFATRTRIQSSFGAFRGRKKVLPRDKAAEETKNAPPCKGNVRFAGRGVFAGFWGSGRS